MTELLSRAWAAVRELSGDDAYERYLAHWRNCAHERDATADLPLDRAAFFREEQRRKWDGVRRCC